LGKRLATGTLAKSRAASRTSPRRTGTACWRWICRIRFAAGACKMYFSVEGIRFPFQQSIGLEAAIF
jgi:hypothetical protein